jgi:hypothetical protein
MSKPESRFPLVREQLTSWKLIRDHRTWLHVWREAGRQAWREDPWFRRWQVLGWIGLSGIAAGCVWLVVSRTDWRAMVVLIVAMVISLITTSQALRRIDRVACQRWNSGVDGIG